MTVSSSIRSVVLTVAASLACALTGAACGSSSSSNDPTSLCQSYAQALLAQARTCDGDTGDDASANIGLDGFTSVCVTALALPGQGLTASQLRACVDALPSTCGTPDACKPKVKGTLAAGAACAESTQCASGVCNTTAGKETPGGITCGTCAAAVAEGAPCNGSDTSCAVDDTCTTSADGGGDATPTCEPRPPLGGKGATCDRVGRQPCASDFVCDAPSDGSTGTCVARGGAGAPCFDTTMCTPGLVCTGANASGAQGTCSAGGKDGGACTVSSDCAVGFTCDEASHACKARAYAQPGATCGSGTNVECTTSCFTQEGATTGTCVTYLALGATCDPGDHLHACGPFAACLQGKCARLDPDACK